MLYYSLNNHYLKKFYYWLPLTEYKLFLNPLQAPRASAPVVLWAAAGLGFSQLRLAGGSTLRAFACACFCFPSLPGTFPIRLQDSTYLKVNCSETSPAFWVLYPIDHVNVAVCSTSHYDPKERGRERSYLCRWFSHCKIFKAIGSVFI